MTDQEKINELNKQIGRLEAKIETSTDSLKRLKDRINAGEEVSKFLVIAWLNMLLNVTTED